MGLAARAGHLAVVNALLEAGADPNGRPNADFLLPVMAERNEIDACAHLLRMCATPNARDAAGRTALFVAVEAGNTALCKVLLQDKRVHVDARRWDLPEIAVEDDMSGLNVAPGLPDEG